MEAIMLVIVTGCMCIWSFMFGAKVGQAAAKGEEITMPNPVEAAKEHKEKREAQKEAEREQNRIDAILRNIDNYDGTGYGQEDV